MHTSAHAHAHAYIHTYTFSPHTLPTALYGYSTVTLETTLARARARYVELLMNTTASQANLATARDSLQPITLGDKAMYDHAVRDLGLPAVIESQQAPGGTPPLPALMPYSAMVPSLLVLAQRCDL